MQQLKVYISSTYEDLKEYRSIVYDTLRQWRKDVIAMEDYTAADKRPLQKCLEDVASSDIYVGIFAWRYGYIPNDNNKDNNPNNLSITELEYRKAKEKEIPCLIFLLDKDEWSLRFSDGTPQSGTKGDDINRLRNELKKNHSISFFKSPDELAKQVSIAVANEIESKAKRSFPTSEENPGKKPYQRVQDNLKDFIGREWIVDEIFNWLESDQRQFFILKGGPGSGKSSIVA